MAFGNLYEQYKEINMLESQVKKAKLWALISVEQENRRSKTGLVTANVS